MRRQSDSLTPTLALTASRHVTALSCIFTTALALAIS
jgi:hypothetical protein